MTVRIIVGDCRQQLRLLPEESVHCVVTSPPYWGLRDYKIEPSVWGGDPGCEHEWGGEIERQTGRGDGGRDIGGGGGNYKAEGPHRSVTTSSFCQCGAWRGAFGLEPDYRMYVDHAVEIFREVWRVLRPDGALWLNLGDSYATGAGLVGDHPGGGARGAAWAGRPPAGSSSTAGYGRNGRAGGTSSARPPMGKHAPNGSIPGFATNTVDPKSARGIGPLTQPNRMPQPGLKPKDLCGIPWRVALALQDDGWWLRQDVIWNKPNPMPESTEDRCTKAHEYLFMLAKRERYYFDNEAIREDCSDDERRPTFRGGAYVHGATFDNAEGGKPTVVGNVRSSGNRERKPSAERGCPDGTGKNQAGSVPWAGAKRNKRSVWTVATQPFPEAHFATFPPSLIEPCVLAGTSERGCCPTCAAPWWRVTAEVETGETQKMADGWDTGAGGHTSFHREGREKGEPDNPVTTTVTLGWYPGCACVGAPPLPRYPAKPSRARLADEAAYKIALRYWREACVAVDAQRKAVCDALAALPVAPAVVLDPFGGAGTTGLVADRLRRDAVLVELNGDYAAMARRRIVDEGPLFASVESMDERVESAHKDGLPNLLDGAIP